MTYVIHQGDCLEVLRTLDAGSVQTCVTSPPYFGLRNYGVDGQIGLEQTPREYVEKLVAVFREVRRVLRDDGTLWLNLGDSYFSDTKGTGGESKKQLSNRGSRYYPIHIDGDGLKPKDLIGIPWRVAFALQDDGWYLRSDIIWHKPNPMPESVTDRPTKSHEYIFLMSKSARYYYDAAAIAEASVDPEGSAARYKREFFVGDKHETGGYSPNGAKHTAGMKEFTGTRNKRTVWTVATSPYAGAHFATFPPKLIEPCILAGTSERGACPACGAPWARVVEKTKYNPSIAGEGERFVDKSRGDKTRKLSGKEYAKQVKFLEETWKPSCSCDAGEPVPCVVLDPFNGSGTTGQVSVSHGREYVGIELNPEYIRLAHERISGTQIGLFA